MSFVPGLNFWLLILLSRVPVNFCGCWTYFILYCFYIKIFRLCIPSKTNQLSGCDSTVAILYFIWCPKFLHIFYLISDISQLQLNRNYLWTINAVNLIVKHFSLVRVLRHVSLSFFTSGIRPLVVSCRCWWIPMFALLMFLSTFSQLFSSLVLMGFSTCFVSVSL